MNRKARQIAKTLGQEAERLGVTCSAGMTKGSHLRLSLSYGGATQVVIAPSTPSDPRSVQNSLALVRRVARGLTGG